MLYNLPFGIHRLYQANACGVEPTQVIEEVYRRTDKAVDPEFFYLHWSLFFLKLSVQTDF
jgi:hypothetical protein